MQNVNGEIRLRCEVDKNKGWQAAGQANWEFHDWLVDNRGTEMNHGWHGDGCQEVRLIQSNQPTGQQWQPGNFSFALFFCIHFLSSFSQLNNSFWKKTRNIWTTAKRLKPKQNLDSLEIFILKSLNALLVDVLYNFLLAFYT